MENKVISPTNSSDVDIFKILKKTKEQYDDYVEINKITEIPLFEEEFQICNERNFDYPLTIVFD